MAAGSANGQVWLFRDVFVGRCDAAAFADARGVDVRCAGIRPKVVQRRVVELEGGGRALIVLFSHPGPEDEVREVELRDGAGRALACLPRNDHGCGPTERLEALLAGVREPDALGILRAVLATSRCAPRRGDGATFGSTFARMIDFLTPSTDDAVTPAAPPERASASAGIGTAPPATPPAHGAGTGGPEIHVLSTDVAVVLDQDLLLFAARAPWPLAPVGEVQLGDRMRHTAPLRCLSLERATGVPGVAFVGMVHAPGLGTNVPDQLAITSDKRRFRLLLGAPERDRPDALLDLVRATSPQAPARVVDFLITASSRGGTQVPLGPTSQWLLHDLLREAGQSAGVIEIVSELAGSGLIVQGWSRHRLSGRRHVVSEADGCHLRRALFAAFPREDLGGDGCGFIGLIEAPDLRALGEPSSFHLREGRSWRRLDWLETGQRLPGEVAHAHLRAMLPRLEADAATVRKLRRIANGGFDGRDTLSAVDRPVRIGLDCAMVAAGTGLFLAGWLLDPTGIVDCLTLRSTAGMAADITHHWTRTARPDLNEAFGGDALLGPHLVPDAIRHGFVAFVRHAMAPGADEEFYLEAVLSDDSVYFVPVAFARREDPSAVRQLLASFDRTDPAASRMIERQIGPFVAAAGRPPRLGPDQVNVLDQARPGRHAERTVVIPLGPSMHDFDVNLATFAVDADFAATQIVAVVPAALGGPAISALFHQAGFYGLDLRLVVTQQALDPCAALEVGAGHAASDTLVFLSASTFARERGWLTRLCRAFDDLGRDVLVSPTLLYEDDSIKFAGLHKRAASSLQPAEAMTSAFAGYPRAWLEGKELTPVLAATIECCVLSRQTLRRLDGFSHEFVAPQLKSIDFMLKARLAGVPSYWLPAVEMVALDEPAEEEGAYWFRNRLVVDDWSFGRKWSDYLTAAEGGGR